MLPTTDTRDPLGVTLHAATSWEQQALHSLVLHLNIGIQYSAILHDSDWPQHGPVTKATRGPKVGA